MFFRIIFFRYFFFVVEANTNTLQNENDANKNSEILNYESLKILSNLFSKDEKNLDKAIDNSKKLVEAVSVDFEAWIERASLVEKDDSKIALECYSKALEIIEKEKKSDEVRIVIFFSYFFFFVICFL